MAMNKVYTRINWEDYPSENTDLDAYNLNQMDSAIDALDNRIISQDALKVDKSAINGNIADWTMDETTGVITITKYNGEKIIFDLNIEKIPVGFSMSDDGIITMTTEDGTQFTADIGSMIPVLTFEDSATIAVSVTGTGKNKTYSFSIKTGSVTDAMLQPNYLADIRVESANASAYAQSANAKSVLAKSYAIGGTGTREGEDTDNAKYYMEQAKQQTGGIPTKVSELENDAGYIKKDVDNLVNYYDKTTTDQKLANIDLTDYLKKTGDASNTTVTFTEPTELAQPTTGEKLGGIIGKVSLAIKNIKTLISLIGNTNISSIGDGTVTGAISDVNGKLGKFYISYSLLCGGDGNNIWTENSTYSGEYYAQYEIPEKEGYKIFFAFWQIAWTSSNRYYNYLIRNNFLYKKTGKIEVYSKDGLPTFVPEFVCVYLPL